MVSEELDRVRMKDQIWTGLVSLLIFILFLVFWRVVIFSFALILSLLAAIGIWLALYVIVGEWRWRRTRLP